MSQLVESLLSCALPAPCIVTDIVADAVTRQER